MQSNTINKSMDFVWVQDGLGTYQAMLVSPEQQSVLCVLISSIDVTGLRTT